MVSSDDKPLVRIFLDPVRKCAKYKPAFGQNATKGLSVDDFHSLYGQDPFYSWIGLDNDLVYAAHKAAGGLTSVYRQIGVGSERLLRHVIMNQLGLTTEQIDWRYSYPKDNGKNGIHILDAKISRADLHSPSGERFAAWMGDVYDKALPNRPHKDVLTGAVFEIRQGYKSADSKRQNADLRYGMRAYQDRLLPVFAILSSQVSDPVLRRYRSDGMLVLTGISSGSATESTFAFFKDVVGYDLASFFQRNSDTLKGVVESVVGALLTPE